MVVDAPTEIGSPFPKSGLSISEDSQPLSLSKGQHVEPLAGTGGDS